MRWENIDASVKRAWINEAEVGYQGLIDAEDPDLTRELRCDRNNLHQVYVEYGTAPWVTRPDGTPVDLAAALKTHARESASCPSCSNVAGVAATHEEPNSIRRCTTCERYPNDLRAAAAVAESLGYGHDVWANGSSLQS